MKEQPRNQTRNVGGGQRVTTVRHPPAGPRARLGYPHDSVLVHAAPAADKYYLRHLFHRATARLADIIEDDQLDPRRVGTTCVWIAPDGTILTARNGTAQVTIFARDLYTGRMRAFPLLPATAPQHLSLRRHHIYDPRHAIAPGEEIYICIESGKAHRAMDHDTRTQFLARFIDRGGSSEDATRFLARLAQRAGVDGAFSITFARLEPHRAAPLLIALFEGQTAKTRRLATGLVPVVRGLLDHDRATARRTGPA